MQCTCGAAWCWICERLDYYCEGGGSCEEAYEEGPDDMQDFSGEEDLEEEDNEQSDQMAADPSAGEEQAPESTDPGDRLPSISEEQKHVREVMMSDRDDAADQERFFGAEPGEDAGLACCAHRFDPFLYSEDTNDTTPLECHRCWNRLQPVAYHEDSTNSGHEPVSTHKKRVRRFSQFVNSMEDQKRDAHCCVRCHILFCMECRLIWQTRHAFTRRDAR